MRVTEDRTDPPGGTSAEVLARRLSEAVRARRTGNGNGGGNGATNGDARTAALEVGAAMLADVDAGTAEHSDDVVLITEAIGERMGITGSEFTDLLAAARLHDIGKAWVPADLLEKPGPLSPEERHVMRQHTVVGERILSAVEELQGVARLVRHSHERWDGRGYPDRLTGPEIPLGSRIIFCADAFHAIRCDRPYRRGRSARAALAEVKRCAGTQFDPIVAAALEAVVHERNRQPRALGGSSRLFALFMCLVIGGAGTAVARSGALGDPGPEPPVSSAPKPPPACGTAPCPTVAGPVGGLGAVPALSGEPGPRVLFPGLPGLLHRANAPGQLKPKPGPNHGRSDEAKQHGGEHGKGKGGDHPSQGGQGSSSSSSVSSQSSSSGGGGGHRSSGGHKTGGNRQSGRRPSGSHRGGGGGGSRGRGGGGGGAPQGGGNGGSGASHGR